MHLENFGYYKWSSGHYTKVFLNLFYSAPVDFFSVIQSPPLFECGCVWQGKLHVFLSTWIIGMYLLLLPCGCDNLYIIFLHAILIVATFLRSCFRCAVGGILRPKRSMELRFQLVRCRKLCVFWGSKIAKMVPWLLWSLGPLVSVQQLITSWHIWCDNV